MTEDLFGRIVVVVFFGVALVVVARNAIGQRHVILWHVRRFLTCFCFALALAYLAKLIGLRSWWVHYAALTIPFTFYAYDRSPKRSRHIPLPLKRRVISRFERQSGMKYDPKLYHIDHKVPFAKWGGHTLDNLRVVPHRVNRTKGGKLPDLTDWWRIWTRKD